MPSTQAPSARPSPERAESTDGTAPRAKKTDAEHVEDVKEAQPGEEPRREGQAPPNAVKPSRKASPFKTKAPEEKQRQEHQPPEAAVDDSQFASPVDMNKKIFLLQSKGKQLDVNDVIKKRSLHRFKKLRELKEAKSLESEEAQYSSKKLDDEPHQKYTRKKFEKNVESKKQKMIKGLTNDQQIISLIQIQEDQAVDTLEEIEKRRKESMWKRFGQRKVFTQFEEHDDEILDYLSLFNNNQYAHLSAIGQNIISQLKIQKNKHKPSYLFDKYVEDQEDHVQEIGLMLQERFRYNKIYKEYAEPTTGQRFEKDAKFQYFMQCQKDQDVILPVLDYVHEKTLCL